MLLSTAVVAPPVGFREISVIVILLSIEGGSGTAFILSRLTFGLSSSSTNPAPWKATETALVARLTLESEGPISRPAV
jgi:hypothetical protein